MSHNILSTIQNANGATVRNKAINTLSKGMNQRVCLARALLHDPKVLILDEPAAGLDPRARVELRELIRVFSDQGKAVLMSSHILTELSEICTGAVIIEQGRVLKAGPLESILANDAAVRTIVIRTLDGGEAVHRSLLEIPGTRDVRAVDGEITLQFAGSEEETADLLAELIRRGHRLAEFRQPRANLEQLFMDVTTGGVQ